MRIKTIASGSSGNCTLIRTKKTNILLDAGISFKRIREGLEQEGLAADCIDAILVTHEHDDHIKGLGVLERKAKIPIYATDGTTIRIKGCARLGAMPEGIIKTITPDSWLEIGDISVLPFKIDHDAADPVAYRFESGGAHAAVATDLGHYDTYVTDHLKDLDAIILEANHDPVMLANGPYPPQLQARIRGRSGHLSNGDAGRLLCGVMTERLRHVILAHISKNNNTADVALNTVSKMARDGIGRWGVSVAAAPQDFCLGAVEI